MTTSEDLQEAYDYLDAHGWCQGEFGDELRGVCLDGALRKGPADILQEGAVYAIELGYASGSRYMLMVDAVNTELGLPEGSISGIHHWNDDKSRTVEDVKLVLKKAIFRSEETGN